MSLNPCAKCGGAPVEQIRGEMKPEDHHMQYARYGAVRDLAEKHGIMLDVEGFHADAHNVECEDEHKMDTRVSCPECGNAIGWQRRDTEEFRNHGPADNRRHILQRDGNLEAIRKTWNEANPVR